MPILSEQCAQGLVQCPMCGSSEVAEGADGAARAGATAIAGQRWRRDGQLASLQAEMLSDSSWVGDDFADTARAMHLRRDRGSAPIHGEATAEQARSLVEEGVPIAPLPLPVVPPSQVN